MRKTTRLAPKLSEDVENPAVMENTKIHERRMLEFWQMVAQEMQSVVPLMAPEPHALEEMTDEEWEICCMDLYGQII